MSTTLNVRQPALWHQVERCEYDALDTMRRDPDDIFAAALAWRDAYVTYAIVHLGETDMLPPGTPYFSPGGADWVRDIHARYHAAVTAGDERTLIELAAEWVTALGTMATSNILHTLESNS